MDGSFGRDAVIANIVELVQKARTEHVPVVWVQHSNEGMPVGSDQWQYVPELALLDQEPFVHKRFGDAFEETELETVLARVEAGRLIVVGAQTDECIRSTLHGAITRGCDTVLVEDAHTTEDLSEWGAPTPDKVIAHTNLYWGNHTAPRRHAGTVRTASVEFFSGTSSREMLP